MRLESHPEKTKMICCKDNGRPGNHPNVKFDFLGYTFQPRGAKSREENLFVGYLPAISNKAAKTIRDIIRSWRLHLRSGMNLEDISRKINPILRGWVNYYGSYYRSALGEVFNPLNPDVLT